MPKSSTNISAAQSNHVNRRKWTEAKKAKVLAYLAEHTQTETIRKFKVSSGQLWTWKYGNGSAKSQQEKLILPAYSTTVRVLARKLQREAAKRINVASGVSELELTALLLTREILGRTP